MDFVNNPLSLLGPATSVLQLCVIIVGGYATLWCVNKVIALIAHENTDPEVLHYYAPYTDDEPDEWELDNLHLDINLEPTPKGDSRTFYS